MILTLMEEDDDKLSPESIPVFGYPTVNYTPKPSNKIFHDDRRYIPEEELGRDRMEESTRRAKKMWSKLTFEIRNTSHLVIER